MWGHSGWGRSLTQRQGDMVTHAQKLSKADRPVLRNAQLPHAAEETSASSHIWLQMNPVAVAELAKEFPSWITKQGALCHPPGEPSGHTGPQHARLKVLSSQGTCSMARLQTLGMLFTSLFQSHHPWHFPGDMRRKQEGGGPLGGCPLAHPLTAYRLVAWPTDSSLWEATMSWHSGPRWVTWVSISSRQRL